MEDRGLWCVTVSNECSSETSCARISVQRCQTQLCTLTQGAWGNPVGQFQGQNRVQFLTSLLSSGPITLGVNGTRSVQISNAQCVLDRLPAGGTPSALPNFGDQVLNTSSCQADAATQPTVCWPSPTRLWPACRRAWLLWATSAPLSMPSTAALTSVPRCLAATERHRLTCTSPRLAVHSGPGR